MAEEVQTEQNIREPIEEDAVSAGSVPSVNNSKENSFDMTYLVKERFEINYNSPLPDLDVNGAKAYAVKDKINPQRELFALLCDNNFPPRLSMLPYLKSIEHPNLLKLIEYSVVDYIPEGMNFNSSLNSNWYTGNDGNLYTTALENTEIAPGESKTLTLILSKTMTNENTGTVSNTAEIASDYNIYGISDIDSTPGNNNQNEDDFARVDNILTVGTGGVWIYISVTVTTALLVGTAVFIVILKRKNKVIKGGV